MTGWSGKNWWEKCYLFANPFFGLIHWSKNMYFLFCARHFLVILSKIISAVNKLWLGNLEDILNNIAWTWHDKNKFNKKYIIILLLLFENYKISSKNGAYHHQPAILDLVSTEIRWPLVCVTNAFMLFRQNTVSRFVWKRYLKQINYVS